MNPISREEANKLFELENKEFRNLETVICAPFVFLQKGMGAPAQNRGCALGAQDCHWEKKGAFTGEISAWMLKDLGVEYIILGHSERGEKCSLVNKKIKAALSSGLRTILCIKKSDEIKRRLKNIKSIKNIAIAYEPTWAIGSGKACSPEKAKQMQVLIKRILTQIYSRKTADKARILYGGSVTEKNAADYALDGLLIGGASLDADKFLKICKRIDLSLTIREN